MTNSLHIAGHLGGDPELRFTPSGLPVATLTIADTPRVRNSATGQWEDGETLWMRCVAWRDLAEGVAETLRKGDRVTAHGTLKQRSYTSRDGEKRTSVELTLDAIGPDLTRATATVTRRAPRQQSQSQGQRPAADTPPPGGSAPDPWGTGAAGGGAGAWGAPAPGDEPPF